MLLLDAFIRFSAIALLLMLALTAVRDIRPSRAWPYLLLTSLSVTAFYLSYLPEPLQVPRTFHILVSFLNVPHLIFVWLFALCVFQSTFRLNRWHCLIGTIYSGSIFWFRLYQHGVLPTPPSWIVPIVSIGSIMLMGHLVFVIIKERDSDLIEDRRSTRIYFACTVILVTCLTALLDLFFITHPSEWGATYKIIEIWPAVIAASIWLLRGNKIGLDYSALREKLNTDRLKLSEKDKLLLSKLENEMQENQVYLDNKITIKSLAQRLAVTPHRLRALINQSMGFDNFNQYINMHRIKGVTSVFDKAENDHIPILTIALDQGFRSLSAFNLAFKRQMGMTPSEYRKKQKNS